jgi:YidC/Oxa1 family membrane protein insertase
MRTILQPLMDLEQALLEGFHALGLSWGLAIVALTVVVRLALVPLAIRGAQAQRRRTEHAPRLKALRAQHRDDSEARDREVKAYVRRHGLGRRALVAGIVVQLVVAVSLALLLRGDAGDGTFGDSGWLMIDDLSEPAGGATLAALIGTWMLLRAASVYSVRRGPTRSIVLRLLPPLLVLPVATQIPAGVLLFLVVSAIWTMGQQAALKAAVGRPALGSAAPSPA